MAYNALYNYYCLRRQSDQLRVYFLKSKQLTVHNAWGAQGCQRMVENWFNDIMLTKYHFKLTESEVNWIALLLASRSARAQVYSSYRWATNLLPQKIPFRLKACMIIHTALSQVLCYWMSSLYFLEHCSVVSKYFCIPLPI